MTPTELQIRWINYLLLFSINNFKCLILHGFFYNTSRPGQGRKRCTSARDERFLRHFALGTR